MTIDIGQFIQIFLEEATEHLAAMESGLLGIDLAEPDPEQLNAIFRAAHSIKGGAGTFGFGDMADFTHTLETLLDRVRRGELALDDERLDACLRAVDVLRELLDGHRSGAAVTVSGADALTAELALLCTPNSTVAPRLATPNVMPAGRQRYQIGIDVPADAGIDATAMATLIDALGQFGTLDLGQRPAGGSPEGRWSITLESDLARSEIGDFISYVLAPEWLRIEAHPCHTEPVTDDGYGFFDPVPETTETADEGFGFFDPLPALAEAADQGFGFFEPLPATDPPAQDEGFGFFEPLPVSVLAGGDEGFGLFEPLPAPANTPDEGFGFFEPLPATVATDTQAYGFFEQLPAETAPARLLKPASAEPAPALVERPAPTVAGRRATDNAAPPPAAGDTTSIRVGISKVDQLINLVGELVITQSMLLQSAATLDPVTHERLLGGLAQLERNSRDLQEAVMSIRMVPMSFVFSRYPRMVRDLAKKLDKQAELHLVGESTELDKGLIEKIVDPLTHLVRNAVDHGLESTEGRKASGKSAVGHITLSAAHQSGQILIEISDDGAGLNRDRILAKAAKQGMSISPDVSDGEVWDLIFAPGFSTAEAVTDVSGRGVGMDVVRKNIHALGGSVHLSSATGQGTRVSIRLPLTLAILDGMSVRAGDETFIVPLGFVIESLHGEALEFRSIGRNGQVVRIRDDYLPVVSLAELFDIPGASRGVEQAVLIVLEAENGRIALGVDALLGQHQVVVKNLETNYRRVGGISGATILGDGQVSLILDVGGLIRMAHPDGKSASA